MPVRGLARAAMRNRGGGVTGIGLQPDPERAVKPTEHSGLAYPPGATARPGHVLAHLGRTVRAAARRAGGQKGRPGPTGPSGTGATKGRRARGCSARRPMMSAFSCGSARASAGRPASLPSLLNPPRHVPSPPSPPLLCIHLPCPVSRCRPRSRAEIDLPRISVHFSALPRLASPAHWNGQPLRAEPGGAERGRGG